MALATLSIDLEARLARLEQDLGKASRMTEREAGRMQAAFGAADATLKRLAGTLSAGVAVTWLTTIARNTIDGMDALNDLSDATGASIENLSALEDVAVRTGTSMETVGDAVVKLNKLLNDAKPGSDQAAALKAIGLSAEELKRQDPAQALLTTAVALAKFANDGDKARLVMELFGKSAAQLAPVLKDLADKGELIPTLFTQQAKEAEKFNNQINELQKNVTDAARAIASRLIPALTDLLKAWNKGGISGVASAFGGTLQMDYLRARLQATTEALADGRDQYAADLKAVQAAELGFYGKSIAAERIRDYQALIEKADEYRASIDKINNGSGARRPANEGGGGLRLASVGPLPEKPKKPEKLPFVFQGPELTAAMADALKRLDQVDSVKLAKLREELQLLTSLALSGDKRAMEALPGVVEDIAKLEPEAKKAAEEMKRLNDILGDTPTGKLGSVLSDIELINAAFERGRLSPEQWAEAIRAATEKLGGETQDAMEEINGFAKQAAANIQDALGDTLLAAMDGKFSDIASLWGNLIKRMVAQAAAAQLGNYLLGNDFAKTGNVGGVVGEFFKSFGGQRAEGGPVSAGRAYLVGERGPEFIVPRAAGTVLPNGVAPGGNRTVNVTINMAGGSGGSQSTALQAGEAIGRQVRLALARNG